MCGCFDNVQVFWKCVGVLVNVSVLVICILYSD